MFDQDTWRFINSFAPWFSGQRYNRMLWIG